MSHRTLQKQLLGIAAMTTEMAILIIAAAFTGGWADDNLQTSPLFLILGITGGFALGMTRILRTLNHLDREHERRPPDDTP
ncbi:MAG: F0F1-type ATP synthase assembly protein I [Myxococcota bacterium]|jgi:F0F1-type ATP synthase assembly protein I